MNIPIYRAKKIGSDEYVEGFYWQSPETLEHFIAVKCDLTKTLVHIEIDPTTLSIHFPDMIDNQGNKIFASLSAIGKGGDLYIEEDNEGYIVEDENEINTFIFSSDGTIPYYESYNTKKVIGIQE